MMSDRIRLRRRVGAALLACGGVAAFGCASIRDSQPQVIDGFGGQMQSAQGGAMAMASGGSGFGGTPTINVPMTPIPNDPNGCKPLSCHPDGGDYCGEVGNGCSGKMNCGACPKSDWVCDKGLCKGPASCQRRTSCTEGQAKYCDKVGDGCGGELDCGSCSAPATCGGTGVANVCGDPACVPVSCALRVGQYCGTVGDGCGHSLNCGDCPNNAQCGGDGIPNVCPGSQGATMCEGIRCNVETCSNGGTTSISGVVYDPAGQHPL